MPKTHFITWHTTEGFTIREPFPQGLEGKDYLERAVENRYRSSAEMFEQAETLSLRSVVFRFSHVECLYFEADDLRSLKSSTPVYTSHYYAVK